MPLCRFFAKGHCQYGSKCRFEHPANKDSGPPLSEGFVCNFCFSEFRQNNVYLHGLGHLRISTEMVIVHDLKEITITWPYTCYGLNVSWSSGSNIIVGDVSPEELRMDAYSDYFMNHNLNNHIAFCHQKLEAALISKKAIIDDPAKAVFKAQIPANIMNTRIPLPAQSSIPTIESSKPSIYPDSVLQPNIIPEDTDFTFGNIPSLPPI